MKYRWKSMLWMTFAAVAHTWNYSDQMHLVKTFRQYTGVSPSLFRDKKDSIMEDMKASSKQMFQNPATERFRESIDPKEIKIRAYPISGTWQTSKLQ